MSRHLSPQFRPLARGLVIATDFMLAIGLASVGRAQFVYDNYVTSVSGAIASGNWQPANSSSSILVDTASGVTGGAIDFLTGNLISVSASSGVTGGTLTFYNDSHLDALAAGAVLGGTYDLRDTSYLLGGNAGSVAGSSVFLGGSASLRIGASQALSATTNVEFEAAATGVIYLGGYNTTVGKLTSPDGIGSVQNRSFSSTATGAASLTVQFNSATSTFGGVISNGGGGALSLVKLGTGTLILTGASDYTGPTSITQGTVSVTTLGNVGGGPSSLGAPTTVADGTIGLGAGTLSGALRYVGVGGTSDRVIDLAGTTVGGNLDASGTGAFVLTGGVTASGLGNKTLNLVGSNTADNEISGVIVDSTGFTTSLSKFGTGTWKLSGVNTFSGGLTLSGGTLVLGNDAALGTGTLVLFSGGTLRSDGPARTIANNVNFSGTTIAGPAPIAFSGLLTLTGNGTLTASNTGGVTLGAVNLANAAFSRTLFINGASNTTINGVVADGFAGAIGSFNKQGTGTFTLNSANTFSGGIAVQGGAVVVGNDAALGTGTIVFSSGSLQGDGTPRTLANNINFIGGSIAGSSALAFTGTLTATGTSTLNLTNTGGTSFNAVNLSNAAAARTLTINTTGDGAIGGTIADGFAGAVGSLTKMGAGTLTIAGTNTFTGLLTVNGGTLIASGGAGALGAGTLRLTSGTLDLRSDTATNFGRNTQYSGIIALVSNRETSGPGVTHTLGTLALDNAAIFTVNAGANVTSGTAGVAFGATTLSVNPTFTVNSGASLALGAINAGGSARTLTKNGSGLLELGGGAGTWASGSSATINQGTVRLAADNVLGVATPANVSLLATSGIAAVLDLAGHDLAVGTLTLNGTATSVGSVTTGTGLLTVGGTVNFSGTTSPGATIAGRLNLGSSDRTFSVTDSSGAANDLTVSAVISGAGGVSKSGNGTLVFSGANTYAGNTDLSSGPLVAANDSAFGTGTLTLEGGTLRGDGVAHTIGNPVNVAFFPTIGGTSALVFSNTLTAMNGSSQLMITNTGGTTFNAVNLSNAAGPRTLFIETTADVTINGTVADGFAGATGTLYKYGAGMLTLNGVGTYTGSTNLVAGVLRVGNDQALGTGTLQFSGGTLQAGTANLTLNNPLGMSADATIDTNGFDVTLSGSFIGGGTVNKTGAGGLTLTGTNPFGGNLNLVTGSVHIGSGGTSGSLGSGTITVGSGTEIVFNRSDASSLSGSISGAGSLQKTGAGMLTLTASSSYSGGTTIAGGIVTISNGSGSAFGTGAVTVNPGATLTGGGAFSGMLQNNGIYSPGASPKLATLSAFSQGASGLLQMELAGLTRGSGYDALDVTGAFGPGGTLAVTFLNSFNPTTGASFDLFNFGSIAGTFNSLSLPALDAGLAWDTSLLYSTGSISVMTSPIPEPSTYAFIVGVAAFVMVAIRRRRLAAR